MRIINKTKNTSLGDQIKIADTYSSRMTGLLNRESLSKGEGLLITHCQSIHMFFMKFSIDVLFVNKNNQIIGVVEDIKPFHLSPIFFQAYYALELPAGTISATRTSLGDVLEQVNV